MGAKPKHQHLDGALSDGIEALATGWSRAEGDVEPFISPPQLRLLKILGEDGPLSVGGAAERMRSLPSSVTRLCNRLEAGGLVRRTNNSEDRREVLINLTADGQQFLDRLASRRADYVNAVLGRMSPAALRALREGLLAFEQAAATSDVVPLAPFLLLK